MDQNPAGGSGVTPPSNVNPDMTERVISERVVSEKVLGSSNPISRFGRGAKDQIFSRLGGVFIGLILIIVSFAVVWQSEHLAKSSAVLKDLPLLTVDQAVGKSGLVKVQGKDTATPITYPGSEDKLIYYHQTKEALELVKSTETETQVVTRDGQDIEQTIEKEVEKLEWVTKVDEEKWAPIVLANKITVKPEDAAQEFNLTEIVSSADEKNRETVTGVLADNDLIVVGEINNNVIAGGETFIVSNLSDSALISSLESSETTTWWLYKLAIALLFGFGLYLLLGPFLLVLDIIPILGNLGKGIILFVALVIGVIFTVFASLLIKYWYLFIILAIVAIVYFISARKAKTQAPSQS